jgi:hypothetical protein
MNGALYGRNSLGEMHAAASRCYSARRLMAMPFAREPGSTSRNQPHSPFCCQYLYAAHFIFLDPKVLFVGLT